VLLGHHAAVVKKLKKKSHGFASGLAAGWHALRTAVSAVLTAVGAALPFVAVVAVIGGIVFGTWRRTARRKVPPAAAPPSTTA
jgi:Domain of unknown function (DUF4349)